MELTFSSNTRKLNASLSTSYKNTQDVIMWWIGNITYESETYEIMSAGNAENSVSQNFNGNIMYRLSLQA